MLSRVLPFFGMQVKRLVPAIFVESLAPIRNWARVVNNGPFSLCVIHKEGLCPSNEVINRPMTAYKIYNVFGTYPTKHVVKTFCSILKFYMRIAPVRSRGGSVIISMVTEYSSIAQKVAGSVPVQCKHFCA
jgi:hypothetical protein